MPGQLLLHRLETRLVADRDQLELPGLRLGDLLASEAPGAREAFVRDHLESGERLRDGKFEDLAVLRIGPQFGDLPHRLLDGVGAAVDGEGVDADAGRGQSLTLDAALDQLLRDRRTERQIHFVASHRNPPSYS